MVIYRPQKKKKPGGHAVARSETTQKKIHLAARSDRRARRASELLTKHAATRNQHAPHLDLSPISPSSTKRKQKSRARTRTRRAFGARITFSFWEYFVPLWLDRGASRRWRLREYLYAVAAMAWGRTPSHRHRRERPARERCRRRFLVSYTTLAAASSANWATNWATAATSVPVTRSIIAYVRQYWGTAPAGEASPIRRVSRN